MSYRILVKADNSGKWASNALRFATEVEAERWVRDLASRWTLVLDAAVEHSEDPVNTLMGEDGTIVYLDIHN